MSPNAAAMPETNMDSFRRGVRAVLLGPPGSGKGTQVSEIVQMSRVLHINIQFTIWQLSVIMIKRCLGYLEHTFSMQALLQYSSQTFRMVHKSRY